MSLQPGNIKLGSLIFSWSVPAVDTCPGKSSLCAVACYGLKGHYHFQTVRDSHFKNLASAEAEHFVPWMCEELRRNFVKILRGHAVGDFYSPEYTSEWDEIASRNRRTSMCFYTRSWRDEAIYRKLKLLKKRSNVLMWFSCDKETGAPPRLNDVRRAYMAVDDDDIPKFKTDLVFRVQPHLSVRKYWPDGTLVCPYENKVTKTTCSQCMLCYRKKGIPRREHKRWTST